MNDYSAFGEFTINYHNGASDGMRIAENPFTYRGEEKRSKSELRETAFDTLVILTLPALLFSIAAGIYAFVGIFG